MLSIFQSGRKRWSDWRSRCQLSSGLSEVLCQIPLPAGPAGSKEINQEERRGGGADTGCDFYFLFMLQQYYTFIKRLPLRSQPVVISFVRATAEAAQKMKWTSLRGSLAADQQGSLLLSLISWCTFLRVTRLEPSVTHPHKYMEH